MRTFLWLIVFIALWTHSAIAQRRSLPLPPANLNSIPDSLDIPSSGRSGPSVAEKELTTFIARVLADTETVWDRVFAGAGRTYDKPWIVFFNGVTNTACGVGSLAMGPFYCTLDRKVYLDMSFFRTLERDLNAPGDFARVYVIAHEIGHHVQNLLGIEQMVSELSSHLQRIGDNATANRLELRLELQADCFAGLFSHQVQKIFNRLQPGDLELGLNAAAKVGSDAMEKGTKGTVVLDSFTHGSSEQRVRWFRKGIESGDLESCDTFAASSL